MSPEGMVRDLVEAAAAEVGPAWPLHGFVTANPLAGFEDRPFHEAVTTGERRFGGTGYPSAGVFRRAWERGAIDPERLRSALLEHGYEPEPEAHLEAMAAAEAATTEASQDGTAELDAVLSKWLAAFLDEGRAHWPMPDRERGFYAAMRSVARHDGAIPDAAGLADLPADPAVAIAELLEPYPRDTWPAILTTQLAALPGWTGFIAWRTEAGGAWQTAHPIELTGYLAVRLALAERLGAPIHPDESPPVSTPAEQDVPLEECWLSAWEASYRGELVEAITEASEQRPDSEPTERPAAQLVCCIDTRSEILRRHLEAAGPYETFGYAGFFGIPMRYGAYDAAVTVDACPPILEAGHHITERPTEEPSRAAHDRLTGALAAGRSLTDSLATNAATAFSFVEGAGLGYGLALLARTLRPAGVHDAFERLASRVPDTAAFCEPALAPDPEAATELPMGLTHAERVAYAAAAFEQLGMERFARVVVFAGHAAETANNPFEASLDCGACAGNPGGPSARVLAAICNDEAVRADLRDRGIDIPEDTVFVAGEHTTTTDEVTLYTGDVPESHADDLDRLEADLETARDGAAAERAAAMGAPEDGRRATVRRAADWAEPRPEWGLAGNAALVVGPRSLTADLDLDGRVFLHSYDPSTDPDGAALESIMTGPLIVTQWINAQYYFSTVDNAVYGSGSKVTQNPVGNVGVHQGNGGDLMTGLPMESLFAGTDQPYHQPLRLSAVVYAPVDRVAAILEAQEVLTSLLDNGWLSLTVVDPTDDRAYAYERAGQFIPVTADPMGPEPATIPAD